MLPHIILLIVLVVVSVFIGWLVFSDKGLEPLCIILVACVVCCGMTFVDLIVTYV